MRFNKPEKVKAPSILNRYQKRHLDAENIIAERLRGFQHMAGLSDRQLAERTGLPANEIRRMKRTGEVSWHNANLLAHAFGPDVCVQGIQSILGKPNRWGFQSGYTEG